MVDYIVGSLETKANIYQFFNGEHGRNSHLKPGLKPVRAHKLKFPFVQMEDLSAKVLRKNTEKLKFDTRTKGKT
jgi:hypothetical protein